MLKLLSRIITTKNKIESFLVQVKQGIQGVRFPSIKNSCDNADGVCQVGLPRVEEAGRTETVVTFDIRGVLS
jgi:hypothetical protein